MATPSNARARHLSNRSASSTVPAEAPSTARTALSASRRLRAWSRSCRRRGASGAGNSSISLAHRVCRESSASRKALLLCSKAMARISSTSACVMPLLRDRDEPPLRAERPDAALRSERGVAGAGCSSVSLYTHSSAAASAPCNVAASASGACSNMASTGSLAVSCTFRALPLLDAAVEGSLRCLPSSAHGLNTSSAVQGVAWLDEAPDAECRSSEWPWSPPASQRNGGANPCSGGGGMTACCVPGFRTLPERPLLPRRADTVTASSKRRLLKTPPSNSSVVGSPPAGGGGSSSGRSPAGSAGGSTSGTAMIVGSEVDSRRARCSSMSACIASHFLSQLASLRLLPPLLEPPGMPATRHYAPDKRHPRRRGCGGLRRHGNPRRRERCCSRRLGPHCPR
mmetsp:Transcript_102638/g.320890  ORF Transcript_102638/g.320890 Transcript_102638/m.320890 type:complete len:398 (+) Transcript_102638:516-1709(+)